VPRFSSLIFLNRSIQTTKHENSVAITITIKILRLNEAKNVTANRVYEASVAAAAPKTVPSTGTAANFSSLLRLPAAANRQETPKMCGIAQGIPIAQESTINLSELISMNSEGK
jgi:hypothetical protein